jgi:hypothetical protein
MARRELVVGNRRSVIMNAFAAFFGSTLRLLVTLGAAAPMHVFGRHHHRSGHKPESDQAPH